MEDNFSYDAEEEFNIRGITLYQWVNLATFGDKFAKKFYGGKFADLPQVMRGGDSRARVFLPPEGNAWPVGRGSLFYSRFDIDGCSYGRASRGVRELSRASLGVEVV